MNNVFHTRIQSVEQQAEGIATFELHPAPPHTALPAFTAGSHIDLQLPNGLVRSYSLVNDPRETHRYVIAVNRDRESRGGSRYLHECMGDGAMLQISEPRNNFRLDEDAEHSVFIAGGIGITPLLCMIRRLEHLGRSWELHYASRSRSAAAFLETLESLNADRARLHLAFDAGSNARMLDLQAIADAAAPGAHLYCCGPLQMLKSFERACAARKPSTVHVEYFAAKDQPNAQGGYDVELVRSGKVVTIRHGRTLLETLLDCGVRVSYSCREGVCGTCEVRVIAGTPDHRDLILSPEEKAANDVMMICCSGSKTPRLVIDL